MNAKWKLDYYRMTGEEYKNSIGKISSNTLYEIMAQM